MEKIDFNSSTFKGFSNGEDILVDTGVLLALVANYDPWHKTVLDLFNNYIFPDENVVLLYTNPTIINEVLHLSSRTLERFIAKFSVVIEQEDREAQINFVENILKVFLEEGVFKILDGDKDSTLLQIELSQDLGAADAANVAIANLYGTSFLTIDRVLADNIELHAEKLTNIKKVYYTTGRHRTY